MFRDCPGLLMKASVCQQFDLSGPVWAALGGSVRHCAALGGAVRLWVPLVSLGSLQAAVSRFGELWVALGGSGQPRTALGVSERLQAALGGPGRPWGAPGGSGRLWAALGRSVRLCSSPNRLSSNCWILDPSGYAQKSTLLRKSGPQTPFREQVPKPPFEFQECVWCGRWLAVGVG